jgi:hypothetical protein
MVVTAVQHYPTECPECYGQLAEETDNGFIQQNYKRYFKRMQTAVRGGKVGDVFIICWRCPYISEKCPEEPKPKGKGICIVVVTHAASTPGAGDERFEQFMVCAGVLLKDYVNLKKSVRADLDGECKLLAFCRKAFDALVDCTDEHGNASGWSMAEFERQTGCAFVRPAAVVRADADLMHTVVVRVSYGANKSMRCTTANRFFFANETNLGSVFMFPGLLYKWLKCAPRSLPIDNAVITRLASLEAIAAEEQRRYNLMIRCASARAFNFPPMQSAFLERVSVCRAC